ncbi:MAG TPA: SDR family NAD(P)-dependent oxidoreductase [Candidatus Acidoferrales bacterium]|nr:SDR family NAD(P)-dependent oxidoreductase [Candidatus Acidoferrales bacterium]
MTQDLLSKVVLITGSTAGLGMLTAQHIASRGATVLLHGRNRQKGKEVLSAIKESTGSKKLEYYNADLSSLDEVNAMAESVLAEHKELHLLVNNAGIGGGPRGTGNRELSRNGYELRFAVNYLSHFLLTHRLLPLIKASAPSRIINVSSIGQHNIDFGDVMLAKSYESFRAYRQSKLAQIMFTIDLSEELKGTGVVVNCLHPATLMNTNMVYEFFGSTMSSVEDGAEALEYVALSEETGKVTGTYFDGKRKSRALDQAYDPDARRQLKELSEKLCGISTETAR